LRYFTNVRADIDQRVTINQQLAPTAEYAKLLQEFEEEARKRVVASYHFDQSNLFHGAVVVEDNRLEQTYTLHLLFTLNGEEFKARTTFHAVELVTQVPERVSVWIVEQISKAIMQALFTHCNLASKIIPLVSKRDVEHG
jgi:hypothetical protein